MLNALASENGDIKAWLEKFLTKPKVSDNDVHVLMNSACAPNTTPTLPPSWASDCRSIPRRAS